MMSATTQEIIELCERLPANKQAQVANYARALAESAESPGNAAWERIIASEVPRPKLAAFFVRSQAEGEAGPLEFDRSCFQERAQAFGASSID